MHLVKLLTRFYSRFNFVAHHRFVDLWILANVPCEKLNLDDSSLGRFLVVKFSVPYLNLLRPSLKLAVTFMKHSLSSCQMIISMSSKNEKAFTWCYIMLFLV